jgi:hypothetical protein
MAMAADGPRVGIVLLPMMSRMLPESARWEHAAASAAWAGSHFYDVFSPAHQWRIVPLIICNVARRGQCGVSDDLGLLSCVSVLKLPAAQGSAILLIGGTISTADLGAGVGSGCQSGWGGEAGGDPGGAKTLLPAKLQEARAQHFLNLRPLPHGQGSLPLGFCNACVAVRFATGRRQYM